jgi:AcrR family transcriptional regulator
VVELGLGKASMAAVADALGLDRTTVHHYFRTRKELVAAAMEQVISTYQRRADEALVDAEPMDRVRLLLDHAFGSVSSDPTRSAILLEFAVASRHDPDARAQLRRAYQTFEDTALAELERSYPDAAAGDRRRIAYAIVQLSEGSSSLRELGFGEDRVRAARETARLLLEQLEHGAGRDVKERKSDHGR